MANTYNGPTRPSAAKGQTSSGLFPKRKPAQASGVKGVPGMLEMRNTMAGFRPKPKGK